MYIFKFTYLCNATWILFKNIVVYEKYATLIFYSIYLFIYSISLYTVFNRYIFIYSDKSHMKVYEI